MFPRSHHRALATRDEPRNRVNRNIPVTMRGAWIVIGLSRGLQNILSNSGSGESYAKVSFAVYIDIEAVRRVSRLALFRQYTALS